MKPPPGSIRRKGDDECLDTNNGNDETVGVMDSRDDAGDRIRALGAEIAGHDQASVTPTRMQRQRTPTWLLWVRRVGLAVFIGQTIYGGVAHDARIFVGGLVLSVVWAGLLLR